MPAKKKAVAPAPAPKKKAVKPTVEGEPVDGGRYLNEAGELIDSEGNLLEE